MWKTSVFNWLNPVSNHFYILFLRNRKCCELRVFCVTFLPQNLLLQNYFDKYQVLWDEGQNSWTTVQHQILKRESIFIDKNSTSMSWFISLLLLFSIRTIVDCFGWRCYINDLSTSVLIVKKHLSIASNPRIMKYNTSSSWDAFF